MNVGIAMNAGFALIFAILTWLSIRFGATSRAMKSVPNADMFLQFCLFVLAPITLCLANIFLLVSKLP